ncbi:MAG: rod-binding protein [Pseudolabrys sp.]
MGASGLGGITGNMTAGTSPLDVLQAAGNAKPRAQSNAAKAKAASEDFEAVFLNSMFQQMFTATDGEGPMSSKGATGVWRSFLTDQYARTVAKSGGIGIAQQVYSALLAQQEVRS